MVISIYNYLNNKIRIFLQIFYDMVKKKEKTSRSFRNVNNISGIKVILKLLQNVNVLKSYLFIYIFMLCSFVMCITMKHVIFIL